MQMCLRLYTSVHLMTPCSAWESLPTAVGTDTVFYRPCLYTVKVCFSQRTFPAEDGRRQREIIREEGERVHGHKHTSNHLIIQEELFKYASSCWSECQSQRHMQAISILAASWKGYTQKHCCKRVVFLHAAKPDAVLNHPDRLVWLCPGNLIL